MAAAAAARKEKVTGGVPEFGQRPWAGGLISFAWWPVTEKLQWVIFGWLMMAGMTGRVRVWVGVGILVAALAGLGVYFVVVGLEDADKLASVIGAFIGLVGVALAVYGLVDRPAAGGGGGGGGSGASGVEASGEGAIAIGRDNRGIASTGDDATNTQR